MNEYEHSADIFMVLVSFILPEIHQKTRGFMMFLGGVERE